MLEEIRATAHSRASTRSAIPVEEGFWSGLVAGAHAEYLTQGIPHPETPDRYRTGLETPIHKNLAYLAPGTVEHEEAALWDDMGTGAGREVEEFGPPHPHRADRYYEGKRHETETGEVRILPVETADELMIAAVEAQKELAAGEGSENKIIRLYEAALVQDPRHMQSLVRYGIFNMGLNRLERAEECLEVACTIDAPEKVHAERYG